MNKSEKYRYRTLKELSMLIRDEKSRISRTKTVRNVLAIFGWLAVFVSFLEALEPHMPIWAISITGIVGGLFVGFAFSYESFLSQWPTLKHYLKQDEIKSDYEALEP